MREASCETNPIQYRDAAVVTAGNLIVRNSGYCKYRNLYSNLYRINISVTTFSSNVN